MAVGPVVVPPEAGGGGVVVVAGAPPGVVLWARTLSGEMAGLPWVPARSVLPWTHSSTLPGSGLWLTAPS
ncbi:hypothetical protein [Kitasatospora albolonga]|uniref:hypothetical protein n=1 Tax=Kitasatospora albolonga TaxID=68173 RepID=UPI0031ECD552